MAISRNCTIKIKGDSAELDSPVFIYQGDKGINLYFTILDTAIKTDNNIVTTSGTTSSTIRIKKPNGTMGTDTTKENIIDGKVKFTITSDLTDDLNEIGMYYIQVHLWDSANNRLTIPPVEFEVKSLLG